MPILSPKSIDLHCFFLDLWDLCMQMPELFDLSKTLVPGRSTLIRTMFYLTVDVTYVRIRIERCIHEGNYSASRGLPIDA